MNTMLMDAYEALKKIREKHPDDPQSTALLQVMEVAWRAMGEDEIEILKRRSRESAEE